MCKEVVIENLMALNNRSKDDLFRMLQQPGSKLDSFPCPGCGNELTRDTMSKLLGTIPIRP